MTNTAKTGLKKAALQVALNSTAASILQEVMDSHSRELKTSSESSSVVETPSPGSLMTETTISLAGSEVLVVSDTAE